MDLQSINITQLLLMLLPIFLIQLGMGMYALLDLRRRKHVRGSRLLWAAILLITLFGVPSGIVASGLYLAWGRNVEAGDDTD